MPTMGRFQVYVTIFRPLGPWELCTQLSVRSDHVPILALQRQKAHEPTVGARSRAYRILSVKV